MKDTARDQRRLRRAGRGLTGLALVSAMGVASVAAGASPALAAVVPPILDYTFNDASSVATAALVPDASGNGFDATVVGSGAELTAGPTGLAGDKALKLPGGSSTSTAAYLSIAPGLVNDDATDLTISAWVKWDGANPCTWPFALGSAVERHVFATTQCGSGAYGAIRDGSEVRASGAEPVPVGVWTHLAVVVDGGTSVSTYVDGELVGTAPITYAAAAAQGTTTFSGYVGKSFYAPDAVWGGVIDDVEVHDSALSAADLQDSQASVYEALAQADAAVDLGDVSQVTASLTLPTTGESGSVLSWVSSNPTVIAADGSVTRPAAGQPDATVTLTPTATRGGATETGAGITATVIAYPAGQNAESELAAAVSGALATSPQLASDVLGSLTLPESGADLPAVSALAGASTAVITWESSSDAISTVDTGSGENVVKKGAVTRGSTDTAVTLTATVSVPGAESIAVPFDLTVPALAGPTAEDLEAYMFVYFTGDSVDGEKLRFAVSEGNNALDWDELNDAQPVLESTLGTKGLRDPFIMRSPEGDRFFLLATDLSVGRSGWGGAVGNGSHYLEIWESTDLVNWGEQRHVEVNLPNAGMTWAPEATYDATIDAYVVYWTSSLYTDETRVVGDGNGPQILMSITRDFRTFTEPTPWFTAADLPSLRPENGLIDSTVLEEDGTFYRFTKATQLAGCPSPDIIGQKSESLRATTASGAWEQVDDCIGRTAGTPEVEGPSVFKANPGDESGYNYFLWVDNYGGVGYIPLGTDSLEGNIQWDYPADFSLPASPRHGSVLAITREERDALAAKWGPNLLVTSVEPVEVQTPAGGTAVALPETISATFADGSARELSVDWDSVTAADLAAPGILTVRGDLSNGAATRATATVTITAVPTEPGAVTPAPSPSTPGTPGTAVVGKPDTSSPDSMASDPARLARTGLETLLPSVLGTLLIAAGVLAMIARKRRGLMTR
ncbi:Glycosyl hydrolases family 43 [Plantibacter sp. VKM Ac-1784]|uniref:Glycosyl hydrolases family 43 n=1 Tax=Plantibacter elymi (nom. nud.) TaxID=199708 RepID=A0ABY1RDY6_9MICO|nr:immunoglobulin-like domain-containing protein [Plantibacter sp. VKM Ac-1784]SMQ71242.1 Glycosyl hydrolases family 43 [Plantibacter sp. VKM Ac-1784]